MFAFVGLCHAEVRYGLNWNTLAGPGILMEGLHVGITSEGEFSRAEFTLERMVIEASQAKIQLTGIRGTCGQFLLNSSVVKCIGAEARFDIESGSASASKSTQRDPGSSEVSPSSAGAHNELGDLLGSLGVQSIRGDFTHVFGGETEITSVVEMSGIQLELGASSEDAAWRIRFAGEQLPLERLWLLLGLDTDIVVGDGQTAMVGTLNMPQTGDPEVDLAFSITNLGFENAVGTVAGAALSANGTLRYSPAADGSRFDLKFTPTGGEALLDFAYLQFGDETQPEVGIAGLYSNDQLNLSSFSVVTPGILSGNGAGVISFGEDIYFNELRFELQELIFPVAAERYLDSILARAGFPDAEFEGRVQGAFEWNEGALSSLELSADDLTVDDERLGIAHLAADVSWSTDRTVPDSLIRWQSARAYDLELGEVSLPLKLGPRSATLLSPTRVPVFDGAINFAAFELSRNTDSDDVDLVMLAKIEAISLAPMSAALGWPQVEGTLAGEIPRIEWVDGVLELGGAMLFEVFDGEVVVDNVSLERPFGVLSTFAADLDINNLDLRQVTSAFEFGEIRGRLDGRIQGMRLLDWQPVAFDAVLQTARGDKSTHRISQRAVDNLSSLGGGAGVALQQTFLRFFENFSYDRLGLRCVLRNNICEMSGVEQRGQGFYIVKGKGIPRIDVVGFQRRVDWPQLLSRLQAASGAGGVTID